MAGRVVLRPEQALLDIKGLVALHAECRVHLLQCQLVLDEGAGVIEVHEGCLAIGKARLTVILILLLLRGEVFAPNPADTLLQGLLFFGLLLHIQIRRLQWKGGGVPADQVRVGVSHYGRVH